MSKQGSIIAIGLILIGTIIVVGGYFFMSKNSNSLPVTTNNTSDITEKPTPNEQAPTQKFDQNSDAISNSYVGTKIAGTTSPYLAFTKSDYDKAVMQNKIIYLDFYANWCPICRAEAPEIEAGFNELTTDRVVGFRVNYNDPETDEDEKALAKEFEIPYQHHKVLINNGQVVLKDGDQWDTTRFLEEINKVI